MSVEAAKGRDLHDHAALFRRRGLIVIALVLVAALTALVLSLLQPVRYSATAVVVVPQDPASAGDASAEARVRPLLVDPQRVMQEELRWASSAAVRDEAARQLGRAPNVAVAAPKDANVLSFTATADGADAAAAAANATAEAYVRTRTADATGRTTAVIDTIDREIASIDAQLDEIDRSLRESPAASSPVPGTLPSTARLQSEQAALRTQRDRWVAQRSVVAADGSFIAGSGPGSGPRVVDAAKPPSAPSSPTTGRNVLLAALAGLVLGIAAAYSIDVLDDRVRDGHDLERWTGLACLGEAEAPWDDDGVPFSLRALALDDPIVDGADAALPVGDLPATAVGGLRVMAVPRGSSGRRARQAVTVVRASGVRLVGGVLVHPGNAQPSASATTVRPAAGTGRVE